MNMQLSEKSTDESNLNQKSSVLPCETGDTEDNTCENFDESFIEEDFTDEEYPEEESSGNCHPSADSWEEEYSYELPEDESDDYIDPEALTSSAREAIDKIARRFPVNRESLCVNKLYKLLEKLALPDADENTIDEVADNLEERLHKAEKLLNEIMTEECPPEQQDMHTSMTEAFENYHSGLTVFCEFLTTPSVDLVTQAFVHISAADAITEEIQENIKHRLEFNTISSVM